MSPFYNDELKSNSDVRLDIQRFKKVRAELGLHLCFNCFIVLHIV